MTLKQLVEALDAQIVKGDIVGAFDTFAADNCVTYSSPADRTTSKATKLEALRWFFNNIATDNQIELIATRIGKDVTDSQFVFDFTNKAGQNLRYEEVIRRTWKNGKIVEEQYLLGQTIDTPEVAPAEGKVPAAKPVKTTAKATKTAKTTAKAAPATTPKPAAKPAKAAPAPAKTDDLVIIEGIGPKIAELLHNAGITSFAQLADTKPAAIKTILETAGKRYQMHDPATWPKQAALARDGKTAELQKLQDKLKAGRK